MIDSTESADLDEPDDLIASRMTQSSLSLAVEYADSFHESLKVAADSARILDGDSEITEAHVRKAQQHLVSGEELGPAKDLLASLVHVAGIIFAIPIAGAFVRVEVWSISAISLLLGVILVISAHALRAKNRRDAAGLWRSLWTAFLGY